MNLKYICSVKEFNINIIINNNFSFIKTVACSDIQNLKGFLDLLICQAVHWDMKKFEANLMFYSIFLSQTKI